MLQISEAAKSIQCDVQGVTWGKRGSRGLDGEKERKQWLVGETRGNLSGRGKAAGLVQMDNLDFGV